MIGVPVPAAADEVESPSCLADGEVCLDLERGHERGDVVGEFGSDGANGRRIVGQARGD